ncbi:MAG: type II secretion system F family protein [Acidimicrobiales bacterium]|jgi:tight adherence protein B
MTATVVAAALAAASVVLPAAAVDGAARGLTRARVVDRLVGLTPSCCPRHRRSGFARRLFSSVLERATRRRRAGAADRALPDLIDATARSVRSGASLSQAIREAAQTVADTPLGADAAKLARELGEGRAVTEAVERFAGEMPSECRRLVCRALCLVAQLGGAPGALLDGLSATLRDRLAAGREARALATQARSSAVVIAVAPGAFALVGAAADARVAAFLVGSPSGWACLLSGAALEAAGAWWMARLVRSGST